MDRAGADAFRSARLFRSGRVPLRLCRRVGAFFGFTLLALPHPVSRRRARGLAVIKRLLCALSGSVGLAELEIATEADSCFTIGREGRRRTDDHAGEFRSTLESLRRARVVATVKLVALVRGAVGRA